MGVRRHLQLGRSCGRIREGDLRILQRSGLSGEGETHGATGFRDSRDHGAGCCGRRARGLGHPRDDRRRDARRVPHGLDGSGDPAGRTGGVVPRRGRGDPRGRCRHGAAGRRGAPRVAPRRRGARGGRCNRGTGDPA
ncbi:hypothetical protein D3230_13775 [Leucobacter chromiireducens subsp. solipictus]|uniref:Uncharacterized protein n=1 Tax=Leucobacter chromiireducens subsp. solipictus TaxID=398235 RepID=A0ABS1SIG2_9MICO|nr:hypothetical protein [Leucobacter chromiireducens subsp. solipictus]